MIVGWLRCLIYLSSFDQSASHWLVLGKNRRKLLFQRTLWAKVNFSKCIPSTLWCLFAQSSLECACFGANKTICKHFATMQNYLVERKTRRGNSSKPALVIRLTLRYFKWIMCWNTFYYASTRYLVLHSDDDMLNIVRCVSFNHVSLHFRVRRAAQIRC